jgi:hypothetical protein
VRGIAPSIYDIDEVRDLFALDVSHKIKKTDFGIGLRYETGDFDNSRYFTQWPGEPAVQRQVTQRENTSYDFFSVHAFTETWLKKNLCFSTGFLFSEYDRTFRQPDLRNGFDVITRAAPPVGPTFGAR